MFAPQSTTTTGVPMAITTTYGGIEYRSRLEARYAAFFAAIGWTFTYEPFDADGYIPDFLIHGEAPLLVEVKPAVTVAEFHAPVDKLTRGLTRHWKHDILIVGASPLPLLPAFSPGDTRPLAGLLGEPEHDWDDDATVYGWNWQPGQWITCRNCTKTAVFHPEMSFTSRPCGCYEGDHYLGHISDRRIVDAWAIACNDVKWRGTAA